MKIKNGYFQVPNNLLEIQGLSMKQKMVLVCLFRTGNQGAAIYPSYKTIARRCSMSKRTAKSVMKQLEALGVVNIERRKIGNRNNTNLYAINMKTIEWMYREESSSMDESSESSESCAPYSESCAPRVVNELHPINNLTYEEPDIKNHKPWHTDKSTAVGFEEYIESTNLDETEASEMIKHYLSRYKQELGKEHKKMKPGIWNKAMGEVLDMYSLESGSPEWIDCGCAEDIEVLIDVYFSKIDKFDKLCDFSIPHFNSPGVKAVLYHEQWRY